MSEQTATLYDAIYSWKDYPKEVAVLRSFIERFKRSMGRRLLDVACGTGKHAELLSADYDVSGLDLDPAMLEIARKRCPGYPFYTGDMRDFDLGQLFDVVTCLFSAIGYCLTSEELDQAIATMARHLAPGGVLIVEPFIEPDRWQPGRPTAFFVDEPERKVVRMNVSRTENALAVLDFHFLIATPAGVEYFTHRHDLALFTRGDFVRAFTRAGLEMTHDPEGLMGRGLYIGALQPK